MVEAPIAADPTPEPLREVRLGLVMNGGVSLAVWIGGVTKELDALRCAATAAPDSSGTLGCYRRLLGALRETARIDVVAGASAGGINGALVAAAVYAGPPLPDLREVWLTVGNFGELLRSTDEREPLSLLRGDEYVLPEIRKHFGEIFETAKPSGDRPISLFVTATDFYGTDEDFSDSTGRAFRELDHRRVFRFQYPPATPAGEAEAEAAELADDRAAEQAEGGIPPVADFGDPRTPEWLANAARSSSSFPVAFEPRQVEFEGEEKLRWLIDGGILDNQPFKPVLNRIPTLPGSELPVRRVVGYVVPYVTEPGEPDPDETKSPTALQVYGAANKLPRDLPKLSDLERISHDLDDGRRAERARVRRAGADCAAAAVALFDTYRRSRYVETLETFALWSSETFVAGTGEFGQLETRDRRPDEDRRTLAKRLDDANRGPIPPDLPWIPDGREWSGGEWRWGLSPTERIASEALAGLRGSVAGLAPKPGVADAKRCASELVGEARTQKFLAAERFRRALGQKTELEAAKEALGAAAVTLAPLVEELRKRLEALEPGRFQRLVDAEVATNAFGAVQTVVPPVFDFLHMSAGVRNSLGHEAATPAEKLAGMKLAHFGGFLKRSWRENDWLWGRLDGVEHAVGAALDHEHLAPLARQAPGFVGELAELAFPEGPSQVLEAAWARTATFGRQASTAVAAALDGAPDDARGQFEALLGAALKEDDPVAGAALVEVCRAGIAARIQLDVLAEELPEIVKSIAVDLEAGASRGSSGAKWAKSPKLSTDADRVAAFRALRIGQDETLGAEASSPLGLELESEAAAVAVAAFSGAGGGLPRPVAAALGSLRGLTSVGRFAARVGSGILRRLH